MTIKYIYQLRFASIGYGIKVIVLKTYICAWYQNEVFLPSLSLSYYD